MRLIVTSFLFHLFKSYTCLLRWLSSSAITLEWSASILFRYSDLAISEILWIFQILCSFVFHVLWDLLSFNYFDLLSFKHCDLLNVKYCDPAERTTGGSSSRGSYPRWRLCKWESQTRSQKPPGAWTELRFAMQHCFLLRPPRQLLQ